MERVGVGMAGGFSGRQRQGGKRAVDLEAHDGSCGGTVGGESRRAAGGAVTCELAAMREMARS